MADNDSSSKAKYWVKISSDDMLIVSGERTSCEELDYQMHEGANLISYCCEESISIDIIPQECYSIIGEGVAASFTENDGWVGNLDNFSPGKGYWLTCSESVQFNWDCSD